jgi:predicted LPLAT superfamily acyltransferase
MTFKPCAIVPSRNHWRVVGDIVRQLQAAGLPVFIFDDASADHAEAVLARLHEPTEGVTVYRFDVNQGKGGAFAKGLALAADAGFTHALQVDADGQHDLAAVPALLTTAKAHPDSLIVGSPAFDATIPRARRFGRWITHFWVCVELLSYRVIDSMCGFRVYPIAHAKALFAMEPVGRGMDFDTDILVRLAWRGVPLIPVAVRVTYPSENTSNFDVLRDNWRITRMHARLVFTMLMRLPQRLRHRRGSSHWSALAERGMYWGLRLSAAIYRLGGQRACMLALLPIVLYFNLTGTEQRRASRSFLRRAFAARGEAREPGWSDSFRHFHSFARKSIETFGAWIGSAGSCSVDPASLRELEKASAGGRGIVLIVSHLGNIELSRALLDPADQSRIAALVHTRHAENYNRVLRRFSRAAALNTIQVDSIGPDTILALKDLVERGGWIAIAGDRTPVQAGERVSQAPFLGEMASFPQGPYILAHLLSCPVYVMFCLRETGEHRVYFEKIAEHVDLPRRGKDAALAELAAHYARRLEEFCLRDPLQWYNFFDFWSDRIPTSILARR